MSAPTPEKRMSGCTMMFVIAGGIILAIVLINVFLIGGCAVLGGAAVAVVHSLPTPVPTPSRLARPSVIPVAVPERAEPPPMPVRPLAERFIAPRLVPNDPDAQKRAAAAYPDLMEPGGPLNRKFLQLVHDAQSERPCPFDEPEWPTLLAKRATELLKAEGQ